jgi:hypothetical protein
MHPTFADPPDVRSLDPDQPPRPRRVGRWLVVLVVVVLVTGAVVTAIRHRPDRPSPGSGSGTDPVATAPLERRDLSTARSLAGSIGYGAARPLAGHQDGTVTWLPKVGATISRGEQLFRVDDVMVPLFYGGMPMYRDISGRNLAGRDVRIVADNLRALGYSIGSQPAPGTWVAQPAKAEGQGPKTNNGMKNNGTNDDGTKNSETTNSGTESSSGTQTRPGNTSASTTPHRVKDGEGILTAGLIQAIKRWQADIDRPVTGTVAIGDVEVASGAVRVDSVAVQPGSAADAPLLSVTSTRKVVTVSADLADAASIERGDQVTVVLPDERSAKARVISVGRDLAAAEDGPGTGPPKLAVTVSVTNARAIAKLDSADVDVHFVGRTAKHVLVAPIEALIALREGGYAVQAPGGLVAVHTGMFADGWVEITGAGLAEGTTVVVSS